MTWVSLSLTVKNFFRKKRQTKHQVEYLAADASAFRLTNECEEGRYRIEKEIVTDSRLNVLLLRTRFVALKEGDLFLHILLAPHLNGRGANNSAWIEEAWGSDLCLPNAMATHSRLPARHRI